MELYNTLAYKKEEFKPVRDNLVRFYSCGPTVYDVAHIGNLRTYVFNDLLKRGLLLNGYKVKHVMNITDVDDKTIKKSGGNKGQFELLTQKYEEAFRADLAALNIIKPDVITRATEYIDKMVEFVSDLLKKGYAYRGDDGSIYFSIAKFAGYGRLSKLDKEGIRAGARVNQDEYDKENPSDFALWKAWDKSDGEIFWQTKLGKGRPGWHIECSTMSSDVLGETLDIHTGGVDNIFPHHENEIAQSEARTGKKFVNFWLHGEHLLVDNKKMAKSAGNFYRLDDIVGRGYSPLDFRYLVVVSHYRSKLNFTWEGLAAAKNARERLNKLIVAAKQSGPSASLNQGYWQAFEDRINDDLDTPGALAAFWEMMRDDNVKPAEKFATALKMDEFLGLKLGDEGKVEIPQKIIGLAEKRQKVRQAGDFAEADKLRSDIEKLGWVVEDIEGGHVLRKNPNI